MIQKKIQILMEIMKSYYKKSIEILNKLSSVHPVQTLGRHLATAFDGHLIENLSDKEMYNILNDYYSELQLDVPHTNDVEEIIKQSKHLNAFDLLEEE